MAKARTSEQKAWKARKIQLRKKLREAIPEITGISIRQTTDGYLIHTRLDIELPEELNEMAREEENLPLHLALVGQKFTDVRQIMETQFHGNCDWILPGQDPAWNLTFEIPPVLIVLGERWTDENGRREKISDARLLSDDEIEESKRNFPNVAHLLDREKENLYFFEFVGGSEYENECFRCIRASGIAMRVKLFIPFASEEVLACIN